MAAPGLSQIRRWLVPRAVRNRVKGIWQMKEQPQLTPGSLAPLRRILDEDLTGLGAALPVQLTCESFKSVALGSPANWAGLCA